MHLLTLETTVLYDFKRVKSSLQCNALTIRCQNSSCTVFLVSLPDPDPRYFEHLGERTASLTTASSILWAFCVLKLRYAAAIRCCDTLRAARGLTMYSRNDRFTKFTSPTMAQMPGSLLEPHVDPAWCQSISSMSSMSALPGAKKMFPSECSSRKKSAVR